MLSQEQINQLVEFIKDNAMTGIAYSVVCMDSSGHVHAHFSANAIQLAFMEKVMANACTKMMTELPNPNRLPSKPPSLVP